MIEKVSESSKHISEIPPFREAPRRLGGRTTYLMNNALTLWEDQWQLASEYMRVLEQHLAMRQGPEAFAMRQKFDQLRSLQIKEPSRVRPLLSKLMVRPKTAFDALSQFTTLDYTGIREIDRTLTSFIRGCETNGPFNHMDRFILGELAHWVIYSRRVYAVPRHLEAIFGDIVGYSKLTWDDVPLPFSSFAIEFEEPVRIQRPPPALESYVEGCLVTNMRVEGTLADLVAVRLLTTDRNRKTSSILTRMDRKVIQAITSGQARERDIEHWNTRAPDFEHIYNDNLVPAPVHLFMRLHQPVELEDAPPEFNHLFKIIAGTCLHLTCHAKGEEVSKSVDIKDPQALAKKKNKGILLHDIPDVFELQGFSLQSEGGSEKTHRTKGGIVMPPHWRAGHGRRKPGFGKDPNAPKDVKVPPYSVNMHLLEELAGQTFVHGSVVGLKPR